MTPEREAIRAYLAEAICLYATKQALDVLINLGDSPENRALCAEAAVIGIGTFLAEQRQPTEEVEAIAARASGALHNTILAAPAATA